MCGTQRLRVNEIFHSVQGEGTRAGERCVFIRLTGCHLRCTYCDTKYAFDEGEWMTLDEILARVRAFNCPTVEVTGGEPLLQPNVYPLMERLLDEFDTVLLETSGTLSIAKVDPRVVRIVDFKCPSSGAMERNDWANVEPLKPTDEVKFVIGTREDYEWACNMVRKYDLPLLCPVLFSPVTAPPNGDARQGLAPEKLAEWLLDDRLDVRLSLQLHKIIWPTRTRGV
jgi:7-carboxy-7-deazaguanine synthase